LIDLGGSVIANGVSKMVFTILAAVAEGERERIRERIRDARRRAETAHLIRQCGAPPPRSRDGSGQSRTTIFAPAVGYVLAGVEGSDVLVAEGALVFVKACELGLEGIVSKRVGSRHSSGNSRQWGEVEEPGFRTLRSAHLRAPISTEGATSP
jgi:hypothetical protein